MQKLTIRAAIEALTCADDEELIKELAARTRKEIYKNTYICNLKDGSDFVMHSVALYAQNRDTLIDQIVKNESLMRLICLGFMDENFEEYAVFNDNWPASIIIESKKGNITATKCMYKIVNMLIDNDNLVFSTIDEMYGEPGS